MQRAEGVSGATISVTRMWSRRNAAACLIVAVLSATATVGVIELTKDDQVVLPPGCSASDRTAPSCLPVSKSGGDSSTLTLIGVPFTLLAALGAAWLTASSANARQRDSLAAEAQRHDATLRHERGLEDRRELRGLLDSLMEPLALAHSHERTFSAAKYAYELEPADDVKAHAEVRGRLAARELTANVLALEPYAARLRTRLGADHELVVAFDALVDAVTSVSQVASKVTWPAQPQHDQLIADTHWPYLRLRDTFFETAARFVGTRLSD
jgi:hypothetical protein